MDLDIYLKTILSLLVTENNINYAFIVRNINQAKLVYGKVVCLINEIPEWLRPAITEKTFRLFRLGNGNSFFIVLDPAQLQGQDFDNIGIVVLNNEEQIPNSVYQLVKASKNVTRLYKVILPT